ncbi:MAG: hypothetical protein WA998_04765 [Gordonia sp. (in: high G+C Gram-positive bacteria)]
MVLRSNTVLTIQTLTNIRQMIGDTTVPITARSNLPTLVITNTASALIHQRHSIENLVDVITQVRVVIVRDLLADLADSGILFLVLPRVLGVRESAAPQHHQRRDRSANQRH